MTPEEAPVPRDDAVARAARAGLRKLAETSRIGSWADVREGAQRLRDRRLALVTGACVIVIMSAGAAAAVVGRNGAGDTVRVASETTMPATSTSEIVSSTSTFAPTTTTTTTPAAATSPVVDDSTTTLPATEAQPDDLQATVTLATSRLFAEVPNQYTLTVHNVSDHAVTLGADRQFGVWVESGSGGGFPVHEVDVTLAAGEQRTFTSEITPVADMIGYTQISAAVLGVNRASGGPPFAADEIGPLPYIETTVVPPNYVEGQPLDPDLGRWATHMSAGSEAVAVGAPVMLHATVRNTGDQVQLTKGFGALAVVCFANDRGPIVAEWAQYIDAATLAPGAEQNFTVEFRPTAAFVSGASGYTACMVGVGYHDDRDHIMPLPNLNPPEWADSGLVNLRVVPARATTTTTSTTTAP